MFKLTVIAEKSKIIREGISILFHSNNLCKKFVCPENQEDWVTTIKDNNPELVIINAELVKEGVDKLKTRYQLDSRILFIGLIYQYYTKELVEMFDEVIYITDTEDTIINKIRNLQKQKHEHLQNPANERLTDREKDVLKLLIQGLSNKEVADKLVISPHTVITHRKNIIEKTGIRSLAGLAVYAILNNIVDMGDINN